jgi:hypothetical protein
MNERVEIVAEPLVDADLPALYAMSRESNWPLTVKDWRAILHYGTPIGHRVNNQAISCINVTSYGPHFASLGLWLVKKQFRGKGLGIALMREVLGQNPRIRSLALISGAANTASFCKLGFRETGDHVLKLTRPASMNSLNLEFAPKMANVIGKHNLERVIEFDKNYTMILRSDLIRERIRSANRAILLPSRQRPELILGYGIANLQADHHLTIGPLVSKDQQAALDITLQLIDGSFGPTRIDLYDSSPSQALLAELRRIGFEISSKKSVLMSGNLAKLPGKRSHIFCPASQAWL